MKLLFYIGVKMKKFLNLIAAFSITASGAALVIGCSGTETKTSSPQRSLVKSPSTIIDIIKNNKHKTGTSSSNPFKLSGFLQTANPAIWSSQLEDQIKKAAPTLNSSDLKTLSFSAFNRKTFNPFELTITSTLNSDTAKLQVYVQYQAPTASDVVAAITDVNLKLPSDTPTSTTDPKTFSAINIALKTANPALSDLLKNPLYTEANFVYSPTTLQPTVPTNVALNITLNGTTASKKGGLEITLLSGAQSVINKLENTTDLLVPFNANPDVTNQTTKSYLKTVLANANPALTTADLSMLSFSGDDLTKSDFKKIQVTARDTQDNTTASKMITAQISNTTAAAFVKNVVNKKITVPSATDPNTYNSDTLQAIRDAAAEANPNVDSINFLAFKINGAQPPTILNAKSYKVVYLEASDSSGQYTQLNLNVILQSSAAGDLANQITYRSIEIKQFFNPSVQNNATKEAILKLVASQNSLPLADFANATLSAKSAKAPLGTAMPTNPNVTLVVRVGTDTALVDLTVWIQASTAADWAQAVPNWPDKLNPLTLVGIPTPASTSDSAVVQEIRTALNKRFKALLALPDYYWQQLQIPANVQLFANQTKELTCSFVFNSVTSNVSLWVEITT